MPRVYQAAEKASPFYLALKEHSNGQVDLVLKDDDGEHRGIVLRITAEGLIKFNYLTHKQADRAGLAITGTGRIAEGK